MYMYKTVVCIDNSPNATHGDGIPVEIGEEVQVVDLVGCCYKIQTKDGEEFILNQNRFVDKNKYME